jgi:hypothetical protein
MLVSTSFYFTNPESGVLNAGKILVLLKAQAKSGFSHLYPS